MSEPHVARISIAPVKSLGLVHPDEVEVGAHGVVGDRRFWLLDEDGRLFNGKRHGPMVGIRPEWDETTRRLALTFPDGRVVDGTVELGEPAAVELYREPLPSHRVVGPWEDAISEFVGEPLTLLWADESAVDRGLGGGTITRRVACVARAPARGGGRRGGGRRAPFSDAVRDRRCRRA